MAMLQPALRPIRQSATKRIPLGQCLSETQHSPSDNFYPQITPPKDNFYPQVTPPKDNFYPQVTPPWENDQFMAQHPMFPYQQPLNGPYWMVVPGSQLADGPSMVAAGTAVPVVPWSDQWNMPQMQHVAEHSENFSFQSASGAQITQLSPPGSWPVVSTTPEHVAAYHDVYPNMGDARYPKGNSRRQLRRQRRLAATGACDAAPEEELQEMRAAVGKMLDVQDSSQGTQPDLNELRAAVKDMIVSREVDVSDLPTQGSFDPESVSSAGSANGTVDPADTGLIDKAESDKVIERLASGAPEEQQDVFAWITSSEDNIWMLAHSRHGCRIIQKALDVLTTPERVVLLNGLQGHIQEALECPHANHVLQKIVEVVPPQYFTFVLEEMASYGAFFARRRFGCRVVERLLEHCPNSDVTVLTQEILQDAEKLCRHPYGNFVMQQLLEHGTPEQKHQIADLLHANIIRLARHRNASHVVEAAFVHCSPSDKHSLMHAMEHELTDLSRTRCGSFVVREMIGNLNMITE